MSKPSTPPRARPFDPSLLDILRCPLTKSPLTLQGQELVATVGGLRYPIRDGIPVLLVDEAILPTGVNSLADLKATLGP